MIKRALVGLAWFMAVGWGLNLLAVFSAFPAALNLPLAAAVGLFFVIDPLRLVWPAPLLVRRPVARHAVGAAGASPDPLAPNAI